MGAKDPLSNVIVFTWPCNAMSSMWISKRPPKSGSGRLLSALAAANISFDVLVPIRESFPLWGTRRINYQPAAPARNYTSRSRSALNSQPSSAITDSRYIQISSTMPAATLPYSTL